MQYQLAVEKSKTELFKAQLEIYIARINLVKIENDIIIEKIKSDTMAGDLQCH